ncbi:MAG: adenosine deaminase [Lactobacillales bacterium]|jgi:adenosine deaminase|nr:adenosine deaminase [Lactobacillales bacterium]
MLSLQTIENMPKVELHCHLDGSIRPATIQKLADMQNIPFPETLEKAKNLFTAPMETKDLNEYLEKFSYVGTLLQTTDTLTLAAYDVISQASEENVKYIEVRFAPSLHTQKGLSLPEVITAVLKGLNNAEQDFGVKSNALLCGMRHEELAEIEKIVLLAKEYLHTGVAGFDLAGNEVDFPPYHFEEVLNLANELSIPLTLHAGECGCGKNVADAILLGASRIGHGIALKDTPEYFDLVRDKKIVLELAPTSNFQTKTVKSVEEYPFKKFLDEGLLVTINTDNRTVSDTTLTKEYEKLADWYDLTLDDFEQVNHHAVFGAFLSPDEKEKLHEKLTQGYKALKE